GGDGRGAHRHHRCAQGAHQAAGRQRRVHATLLANGRGYSGCPGEPCEALAVARAAGMTDRWARDILALQDFEPAARRYLPRPLFGYIAGAAETNASLRDNRAAFEEYGFVPRTLVNTSARSLQVELFGKTYSAPFGICPMGM